MPAHKLTSDLQAAQAFLDALDHAGVFTFQTFDDKKGRGDRSLARIFHGTLSEHAAALTDLQQRGAGVFVMINEGDGTGRGAANVKRVRAHFLDLDDAPIEPVLEADLPPHIVVESSPGKFHVYWRVDHCPLDRFKERQHALADRFNGDHSVCDLSRVLRLPGFWHLKGVPFQARLITPSINK